MSLRLTILGCHSATPRSLAYPTSQYLEINNRGILIDCGEGTQRQLRKYKIKFSRISMICISHLHGDHLYGLIGLLSTLSLLNRTTELRLFGPKGIREIIELQLKVTESWIGYPLVIQELSSRQSTCIFEDENLEVHTIPLKHRIYTNGFLFREKPQPRKLDMKAIGHFPEIDVCDYQNIKKGKDFKCADGTVIPNTELTDDPPSVLQYAFCSDTAYSEKIVRHIENVDLLYHESTFLEAHAALADKTKHATARQAGRIAKLAGVKKLVLGHYSSRYKDINLFLEEAQTEFDAVELSLPGKVFEIHNAT